MQELARAEGLENPTREQLARWDRKRNKKGSNQEGKNPYDPDARITKMKDGRTHLAHKAEHAVDLSSGAVVAVTLPAADRGDTTTMGPTLDEAQAVVVQEMNERGVEEVVADKGYHSGPVLQQLHRAGMRSFLPEPERGWRHWEGKAAEQKRVYENRRRVRGERSQRRQKKRGELTERSFAHAYETGGLRRLHLKGRENILKRLVVHLGGFHLGLVMRKVLGVGKPRQLQGRGAPLFSLLQAIRKAIFVSIRFHRLVRSTVTGRVVFPPRATKFLGAI